MDEYTPLRRPKYLLLNTLLYFGTCIPLIAISLFGNPIIFWAYIFPWDLGFDAGDDGWNDGPIHALTKLGAQFGYDEQDAIVLVHLEGHQVDDDSLVHLKGLKDLEALTLYKTRVTEIGLHHLTRLSDFTRLEFMDYFDDAGLESLSEVRQLKALYLPNSLVTDDGLKYLAGLVKLEFLDLCSSEVSDAGLKHLKALPRLSHLNLNATAVTDIGLEHLKGLKSLTYLGLDDTEVTDAGLVHLKGLTNLEGLILKETNVTAAGVEKL